MTPPMLVWSDDERAALQEIRRACRFQSDADAIRGALWWYARFLELDVPSDVFALALPAATRARVRSAIAAPAARSDAADDQGDLGCEEHEGFLG